MILSFDFGGSTTDLIQWEKGKMTDLKSFEWRLVKNYPLEKFLNDFKINWQRAQRMFVTGGQSRFLPNKLNNVPIVKVNEIEAIGRGGWEISSKWQVASSKGREERGKGKGERGKEEKILVVSMGTGTCMVEVRAQSLKFKIKSYKLKAKSLKLKAEEETPDLYIRHIGGTGVGGGTFLGLAKELLGETDIPRLIKSFKKGDRGKVDLSVEEIVGGGIGLVPAWGTASNLAKLWLANFSKEIKFTKNDLAAGIANLIGQTIGITSVFAAKAYNIPLIVLTGKLTRVEGIMEIIFEVGKVYGVPMILPEKAGFVGAIGAGRGAKKRV